MQETIFVHDLAIVLAVATAAVWLLQRIGLSAVVGYLPAGIVIGPFSPVIKLVSDLNNIQLLAQIGLVFLMFSIGLGLSLARLQRMGLSIIAEVIISSLLIFNVCRVFGLVMQWGSFETLFLAGMLMVSSSAIIIKVLDELNITHQRAGVLAATRFSAQPIGTGFPREDARGLSGRFDFRSACIRFGTTARMGLAD